jgi:O-antigen/teichoic acid export membrane protein
LKDPTHIKQIELNRVAGGALVFFSGIVSGGALQYLYHIVLARYLGTEALGLFVLGLTIVSIGSAFSRMGLDNGILRFVSIYRGSGDDARVRGTIIQALSFAAVSSLVIGILIFVFSDNIAAIVFKKPDLSSTVRVLSVSIPFFTLMTLALTVCQAFYIAKYTTLVQSLLMPGINIIIVLVLFNLGMRVEGAVIGYFSACFIAFIIAFYFMNRVSSILTGMTITVYEPRKLLMYSFPLLGVTFLDYIVVWTDTLMVGFFRTSSEVGLYSAAVKTSMLLVFILVSFNFIFAPVISDLHNRKEMRDLEIMFKTITRWSFTCAFPLFLMMVIWGDAIMGLFGSEFILAVTPLVILSIGQLINLSTGSVGTMLIMTGRTVLPLINSIVAFILNVIFNYVLIPKYGIVGAAYATSISLTIFNLLRLIEVVILFRMHPYSLSYIKPIIAGISSVGIVSVLTTKTYIHGFLGVGIGVFAIIVLYAIVLLILGFEKGDKELILDFKDKIL